MKIQTEKELADERKRLLDVAEIQIKTQAIQHETELQQMKVKI